MDRKMFDLSNRKWALTTAENHLSDKGQGDFSSVELYFSVKETDPIFSKTNWFRPTVGTQKSFCEIMASNSVAEKPLYPVVSDQLHQTLPEYYQLFADHQCTTDQTFLKGEQPIFSDGRVNSKPKRGRGLNGLARLARSVFCF